MPWLTRIDDEHRRLGDGNDKAGTRDNLGDAPWEQLRRMIVIHNAEVGTKEIPLA